MRKRGRPRHPDILTPREWEVMEHLRQGKSNPEIAQQLGISRAGAKYHVSEILGKLHLSSRLEAASWSQRPRRAWWVAGLLAFLPWPFKNLWLGSAAKVTAAAAVTATVVAFAVPEGFGLLVTAPEIGPVPDFSDFSYITAEGRVRLADNPARDVGGAWSPNCSSIAFTSNRTGSIGSHDDIYTMGPNGTNVVNLTQSPRGDSQPAWSADGARIAYVSEFQGNSDIYVMNSDGSGQTNLTNLAGLNRDPAWSPDGERILYTRYRSLTPEVYVMNSDGTLRSNLSQHEATDGWASWSPDGDKIAFASNRHGDLQADPLWLPTLGTSIYAMNADGTGITRLTSSTSTDVGPRWSPDGQWLSFTRVELEGPDVYIMRSDGSDLRFVVDGHGGAWSSCKFQGQ